MNPKPIEEAQTRDLALALAALQRARKRAEEVARATNTAVVQMIDGQIVRVMPSERAIHSVAPAAAQDPEAAKRA